MSENQTIAATPAGENTAGVIPAAYVYIVRCADHTLYTGWTDNPIRRLRAHNEKKGAKYTKPRTPVQLVYLERCVNKGEALRREAAIKKLTRAKKEALIRASFADVNALDAPLAALIPAVSPFTADKKETL